MLEGEEVVEQRRSPAPDSVDSAAAAATAAAVPAAASLFRRVVLCLLLGGAWAGPRGKGLGAQAPPGPA